MPYWKFLIANVLGGIVWAGGTTAVIYSVGVVAEAWLKRFSWLGLLAAVLIGLVSMLVLKNRAKKAAEQAEGPVPHVRARRGPRGRLNRRGPDSVRARLIVRAPCGSVRPGPAPYYVRPGPAPYGPWDVSPPGAPRGGPSPAPRNRPR